MFDADSNRVVTEILDLPRATGVWVVPSHHQVYVSAAGNHEVAIIDDRTLKVTSRVGDIRFPVDPRTHRVYLPLENIGGKPMLRVYLPATASRVPDARR